MSPSPTLTRELLARYLAGDFEAERRLFERFRPALLAWARRHPLARVPGAAAGPEDAVQEVFWRALSSGLFDRFEDRGPGSLEALLTTVLERTLADMARRATAQRRAARREVGEFDELVARSFGAGSAGREATPTSHAREGELVEFCRRTLAPREWDAWRLVEISGWSAVNAARELDQTAAAVRGLLHRARTKLARALGDAEGPRT